MKNFLKKLYRDFYLVKNILFDKNHFYKVTKSQNRNQENIFVQKLSKYIVNKSFVEVGFDYSQFNFIYLIKKLFTGVLVDAGSRKNIFMMKLIVFLLKRKVKVLKEFITLDNILDVFPQNNVGALSIDIDGNDFHIINKILNNKIIPEVIVIEYNSTFLNKSITIPYKKNFNRFLYHNSGFYHGASLKAFCKLFKKKNYYLVKIIGGINAIFVNKDIFYQASLTEILSKNVKDHNYIREKISKLSPIQQFQVIRHMPFIKV